MCSFIDRTGERHLSNDGCWMTIIIYRSTRSCDIQFDDGTVILNRGYSCVKNGKVKNTYHPFKYGIGFIGEGKYITKLNKRDTKEYTSWSGVLKRGNSKFFKEKNPTYRDATVCKEWHNYQNFAKWHEQNYHPEIMKGWHLDKDILLKGNKLYSPETCCFVPHEINSLIIKSNKCRGVLPIGVKKQNKKYISTLSKNGKCVFLGSFDTPEEAFQAYKIAKEAHIKEVADEWRGQITEPCYQALYNYKVEITD